MCGIAGIFNLQQQVHLSQIKQMTDAIPHRGPDGEGHWINSESTLALGHRRLSIIDLTDDGKQPMHFSDGRYTITFNGEIYNYIELKEQLIKQGVKFRSQSDTEVLLALFSLKKEKCVEDLDGMFSFAIWDNVEKKLFCARDRFGEKPFYYHYVKGEKFIFGSEMKELWSYGIPKRKNDKMLLNFFLNKYRLDNYENPSETFFLGIQKLEPAHYIYIDKNGTLTKKQYWDINTKNTNDSISFEEASEKFKELLYRSISLRLRSDVPVGSSLSGGLDSSTIVCAINKMNSNKNIVQKTFSARFKNFEKDEGYFMQQVIDSTNAEAHFTYPDEEAFVKEFQKLCYHQEEPFGGGSIFAQWKVMELARKNNVTVLLDGQGADEIMAGYLYYFQTYLYQLFQTCSPLYLNELASYQKMHNPNFKAFETKEGGAVQLKPNKIKTLVKDIIRPVYRTAFTIQNQQLALNNNGFLTKEFQSQFNQNDVIKNKFGGGLTEQLYINTRVNGLQDLLRFADRNSMAHSREVRLPFLNHNLVEFLFTLPSHYKIHNGWTKYILRKSAEDILPKEITWRVDKIGYEPPQKKWMENPIMKDLVNESMLLLEKEKIVSPKREQQNQDVEWGSLVVANTLFK